MTHLAARLRYYALLFSHEFARSFWSTGSQMSFTIPSATYSRVNTRGEVVSVTRKPFTRRVNKPDTWKYHLGQMATAEDPIAYLSRFLIVGSTANGNGANGAGQDGRMAASA